jgi:hypothetical protein
MRGRFRQFICRAKSHPSAGYSPAFLKKIDTKIGLSCIAKVVSVWQAAGTFPHPREGLVLTFEWWCKELERSQEDSTRDSQHYPVIVCFAVFVEDKC